MEDKDKNRDGEYSPSFKDINNEQLGFYKVGNKSFVNKVQAHIESQITKEQIYFYYNDLEFSKINWYDMPEQDLYELYAQRARQLREQYDYVCLFYSGGSDSSVALQVFLENNIKLDDVVFLGFTNSKIRDSDPVNSELYYTGMNYIRASTQKNLKLRFVNLWDYFEEIDKTITKDWIFEQSDARIAICSILKEKAYSRDPVLLKKANEGKKVCLLMGLEKPRISIQNNEFTFSFLDILMYGNNYPAQFDKKISNITVEKFYTSINCVDIIKKQIHIIADFYLKNFPNDYRKHLTHTKEFKRDEYYNNINPLIYPKFWDESKKFSVGKGNEGFFGPKWNFMKMYKETNYYKQWYNGILHLGNTLSTEHYDPETNYLSGVWSKYYTFKKCPDQV